MPVCTKIKGRKRQICIGDLDQIITLQNRSLTAPAFGVDATETFTDANPDLFTMVKTVTGESVFDGTETERTVTHRFYVEFLTGITAETWILFDGNRYDILDVEDLDERHEWLLLRATKLGTTANQVNEA